MNFEFSQEQTMMRDSLSRYLRDTYDFDRRQAIVNSDEGWSRETWTALAEMGIMAAAFPEEYDGFGGSASDIMVIMEELGISLSVEPYLPTIILCGQLLRLARHETSQALIRQMCAGELIMALAYSEPKSRFSLSYVETKAEKSGGDYVLNGYKSVVLAAPIADRFIVSARTSGHINDEAGLSLFVLDKTQAGVSVHGYSTVDGHQAGDVRLENVKISSDNLLGEAGKGFALLQDVIDIALLAVASEGIGLSKRMCDLTREYIQTREQFGQKISKFQVLQHKMVDMFIHSQELVSMAYMGAAKMDSAADNMSEVASSVKVQLGKTMKFVGENAIQLHGGMGMTEEMAVGHYFMRGTMLELMFGNLDYHLGRYQRLSNLNHMSLCS